MYHEGWFSQRQSQSFYHLCSVPYMLSTHTHVHHNIDPSSYTMATTVTHCMVEQYKHIVQPNILRDALCGFWSCVKYLVT